MSRTPYPQFIRGEMETISAEKAKPDQLVEYHALSSDVFRQALNVAYADAEAVWAPCKRGRDINEGMAMVVGEVALNEPFQTIIDYRQYLILMGLRTNYLGSDRCKIEITADGIVCSPFLLDSTTRYLIFFKPLIWRPEKYFYMRMQEGQGKLQFVCLGATLYKGQQGFGSLAYTVVSDAPPKMAEQKSQTPPNQEIDVRVKGLIESLEDKSSRSDADSTKE